MFIWPSVLAKTQTIPTTEESYPGVMSGLSPILYWEFDETGATAEDSTVNDRDGTFSGTYTRQEAPLLSDPSSFSSSVNGGYVIYAPDLAFEQLTSFSATFLVNFASVSGKQTIAQLGLSNFQAGLLAWNLSKEENNTLSFKVSDGLYTSIMFSDVDITIDQTYHITVTWDGTLASIYVDFIKTTQNLALPSPINHDVANYYIGVDPNISSNINYLNAIIDDTAYFDRALTDDEVYLLVASISNVPPMLLWDGLLSQEYTISSQGRDIRQSNGSTLSRAGIITPTFRDDARIYFELVRTGDSGTPYVGFSNTLNFIGNYSLGRGSGTWSVTETQIWSENSASSLVGNLNFNTTGAVLMVAIDGPTGSVWFGLNGAWLTGADPATFSIPTIVIGAHTTLYAAVGSFSGNTTRGWTLNSRESDYIYPVPFGYN